MRLISSAGTPKFHKLFTGKPLPACYPGGGVERISASFPNLTATRLLKPGTLWFRLEEKGWSSDFFHRDDLSVEVFSGDWVRVYRGGAGEPLLVAAIDLHSHKTRWQEGNEKPVEDRLFILEMGNGRFKKALDDARVLLGEHRIEIPQFPSGYPEVEAWMKTLPARPRVEAGDLMPGMLVGRWFYDTSPNGEESVVMARVEDLLNSEQGWFAYRAGSHPVLGGGIEIRLPRGSRMPRIEKKSFGQVWFHKENRLFLLTPEDLEFLKTLKLDPIPDHAPLHREILAKKRFAEAVSHPDRSPLQEQDDANVLGGVFW